MLKFLYNVDVYFSTRPRLFFSILAILSIFLITSILLSVLCPPAVLAIGFGVWSVIGNILPLTAIGLITVFGIGLSAVTIARGFQPPFAGLIYALEALSTINDPLIAPPTDLNQSAKKTDDKSEVDRNYPPLFTPNIDNSNSANQPLPTDKQEESYEGFPQTPVSSCK